MLAWVVVGSVVGGLVWITRVGLREHRRKRACKRAASQELGTQLAAAIDLIDLALRDDDYSWLAVLRDSSVIDELWAQHSDTIWQVGHERWRTINNAVQATHPSFELMTAPVPEQRLSLAARRERLLAATDVLASV